MVVITIVRIRNTCSNTLRQEGTASSKKSLSYIILLEQNFVHRVQLQNILVCSYILSITRSNSFKEQRKYDRLVCRKAKLHTTHFYDRDTLIYWVDAKVSADF